MVVIEGIKVQAKRLPKRELALAWRKLTTKPFPKVIAVQLKDDDFNRIICLRRCKEDELRELEEWDTILTTEGTDACVFNADEEVGTEYLILIRESHYHAIKEIVKHELLHIVRGDL